MSMFPHTVTVLNKVESDDSLVYYPTVISGVLFVNVDNNSKSLTGLDDKDTVKCTIPFSVSSDHKFVDGLEYSGLPIDEKKSFWTLRKDDVIVKGVVESPISKQDLINTFDYLMTITKVSTNDFGNLKHWFVGGV